MRCCNLKKHGYSSKTNCFCPFFFREINAIHVLTYSGPRNSSRIADLRSIRPKFRPLPGRVRRVTRPFLSHMFEQMSPIFIKLHCHYSVLPGFVAGTSDIRTTFILLHKWRKKLQLLISEVPGRKPGKTK